MNSISLDSNKNIKFFNTDQDANSLGNPIQIPLNASILSYLDYDDGAKKFQIQFVFYTNIDVDGTLTPQKLIERIESYPLLWYGWNGCFLIGSSNVWIEEQIRFWMDIVTKEYNQHKKDPKYQQYIQSSTSVFQYLKWSLDAHPLENIPPFIKDVEIADFNFDNGFKQPFDISQILVQKCTHCQKKRVVNNIVEGFKCGDPNMNSICLMIPFDTEKNQLLKDAIGKLTLGLDSNFKGKYNLPFQSLDLTFKIRCQDVFCDWTEETLEQFKARTSNMSVEPVSLSVEPVSLSAEPISLSVEPVSSNAIVGQKQSLEFDTTPADEMKDEGESEEIEDGSPTKRGRPAPPSAQKAPSTALLPAAVTPEMNIRPVTQQLMFPIEEPSPQLQIQPAPGVSSEGSFPEGRSSENNAEDVNFATTWNAQDYQEKPFTNGKATNMRQRVIAALKEHPYGAHYKDIAEETNDPIHSVQRVMNPKNTWGSNNVPLPWRNPDFIFISNGVYIHRDHLPKQENMETFFAYIHQIIQKQRKAKYVMSNTEKEKIKEHIELARQDPYLWYLWNSETGGLDFNFLNTLFLDKDDETVAKEIIPEMKKLFKKQEYYQFFDNYAQKFLEYRKLLRKPKTLSPKKKKLLSPEVSADEQEKGKIAFSKLAKVEKDRIYKVFYQEAQLRNLQSLACEKCNMVKKLVENTYNQNHGNMNLVKEKLDAIEHAVKIIQKNPSIQKIIKLKTIDPEIIFFNYGIENTSLFLNLQAKILEHIEHGATNVRIVPDSEMWEIIQNNDPKQATIKILNLAFHQNVSEEEIVESDEEESDSSDSDSSIENLNNEMMSDLESISSNSSNSSS